MGQSFMLLSKMPLKQSKSVYFFIFLFKRCYRISIINLINHKPSGIIHTGMYVVLMEEMESLSEAERSLRMATELRHSPHVGPARENKVHQITVHPGPVCNQSVVGPVCQRPDSCLCR